jgi:EAL and modified HD-GYP domain-containing signal transduction protein
MEVYVARQAIFDINKQVIAYELLFRNNNINKFISIENSNPTLDVIKNSFSIIGFDKITEGKLAFINFDEDLLRSEVIEGFPKDCIVVEILETVNPDGEIIECCKNLKEKGYTIALDDFEYNDKFDELMKYVDIIKVDFIITKGKERKEIIHRIKNKNIKFLAEKVETEEEYRKAVEYGYSYFQGYFFCKPVIVSGQDIFVYKLTYIKLIKELGKNSINIVNVENLFKSDVSLSYKLLKIVNSAHYGLKREITSIHDAIMLVGIKELKRWIFIITLKSINQNNIEELVKMSLIRAYFGELIVKKIHLGVEVFDVFLTGLFSLIDALMNRPIGEISDELPVSKSVKDALLGKENMLGRLLKLIIKYEKGNWEEVNIIIKKIGLDEKVVNTCYLEAIESLKCLDNI